MGEASRSFSQTATVLTFIRWRQQDEHHWHRGRVGGTTPGVTSRFAVVDGVDDYRVSESEVLRGCGGDGLVCGDAGRPVGREPDR